MRKIIALGVMLLFLGMTISSSVGFNLEKQSTIATFDGNTLYVGGSGPNNYTRIQDAIDDASDGDTVFVYDDSSPYQQSNYLLIEKSINLIGENKYTTVISGSIDLIDSLPNTDLIISITTDWVNISGFTIQNCVYCGIEVAMCDNINISGNIFIDTGISSIGIYISNYSYITDNIFTNNLMEGGGIYFQHVSFTSIIGNIFTKCLVGISIYSSYLMFPNLTSNSNIISGNLFDNNDIAMLIRANNTFITRNTISNHTNLFNLIVPALFLEGCKNTVTCNNFINNIRDAKNFQYIFSPSDIFKIRKNKNIWDGNYWGKQRFLPKIILSFLKYERSPPGPVNIFPFINIDWNPAQEPYDIGV